MLGVGALFSGLLGTPFVARRFVFPVQDVRSLPSLPVPPDVLVHRLVARDGVRVRALELPRPDSPRTIVYFHNNRETAESLVGLARGLRARGFEVVLAEYRGYGGSSGGTPSEQGLYLDAEAVLDMLDSRGTGRDRVVLWGTSLGSGVAAEMASRGRGARLVLVSPYTSIPDLVSHAVPPLPARALVWDHFDTLAKSAAIHVPTLVVHGDADEIVPFAMGERLSSAIAGARLLRISGGHHGDLFVRDGDRLLSEITIFAG